MHRPFQKLCDPLNRGLGFASVAVMWGLVLTFFGYIAYQGASAVSHYGWRSIFLSTEYQLSASKVSFWAPFGVTVFLALVTVLLTIPAALKCSIWIVFYCPHRYKNILSTVLLILANIPSIILAMYVRKYLSTALNAIIPLSTGLNLIVASIALVCMILPLIIVLFNAALDTKQSEIISGELLGLDKSYSIRRIIVPKIKTTVIIAVTFVIGRALSESIMLSMILSSENYQQGYGGGLSTFINSQLNSIAPLIGENYFADGSSEHMQNLMFLFGGLLLASSLLCNYIFLELIRRDKNRVSNNSRSHRRKRLSNWIKWSILKVLCDSCRKWETGEFDTARFIFLSPIKRIHRGSTFLRRSVEYLCLTIFLIYAITLMGTVVIDGLRSIFGPHQPLGHTNDTLGRSIQNTFKIVFLSILASIPIALFSSIYLSEYSKNGRFKKYSLSLINAASSTPSIIFGIFGLFIFIQKLGLTASGTQGKSLLAGILTMTLFILPYITQLFYTNITNIHHSYREASYILGISKGTTFWKVIAPMAFDGFIFSILLTTGKIMGETAPLYLTSGINSAPGSLFMYQGQTLTTRIYSQLYETKIEKSEKIINEASFYCLLFIAIVVILAKYANRWLNLERWRKWLHKWSYAVY